ncbi:MAG: hypothetical protein A2V99_03525 [Spirochaetes bacterium RBG_16_67_19]|nr:MAG: hypothetical protein A2V99_03525 [Spirochaetes bacterium RBG_16_67_19]
MRIVFINNEYQQPGGEEEEARNEIAMLAARGHEVQSILYSNREINSGWRRLRTAWRARYSRTSRARISRLLAAHRPNLVHVHNFFPLVTPSVYDACQEIGVPVVQTLHNYRIICPGALLKRGKAICEECVQASAYRAVSHRCYRGSWLGTLAVARMVQHHRVRRTWREKVGCFIALTEFAKGKFAEGGVPEGKIVVKPNFTSPDPGAGKGGGGFSLYVGRLSPEKGLDVLLQAWEKARQSGILKIVGSGPLAARLQSQRLPGVQYLGFKPKEAVIALMKEADFLILPSVWYEGLPMALIEAYSTGLPVVGSRIGALVSLIQDGRTGLLFRPNDPEDLVAKIYRLRSRPAELAAMREAARDEYLEKYTEQRNYDLLIAIYERVIADGGSQERS